MKICISSLVLCFITNTKLVSAILLLNFDHLMFMLYVWLKYFKIPWLQAKMLIVHYQFIYTTDIMSLSKIKEKGFLNHKYIYCHKCKLYHLSRKQVIHKTNYQVNWCPRIGKWHTFNSKWNFHDCYKMIVKLNYASPKKNNNLTLMLVFYKISNLKQHLP